jgi:aryl-alcohol dehydrogenase-like predicted oxidoreductase
MEYRSLGRTGVQVSVQCLGTWMFGYRTEEQPAIEIIDRALDRGINFIDTANIYSFGHCEEIVGKALKRNGKRSRIVLVTKVHNHMDPTDPNARGNSRRHIIAQCDASLRRLQTDYIDLYLMHRPSSKVPIDETLRALDDLVHAGKVRYLGTSTFAAWQIVEALWASKELGLNRFVCDQPPYHILDRRIERELVPLALTYGIGIILWSPLAQSFLSSTYHRGMPRPKGSRFDEPTGPERAKWVDSHFTDQAFDVLEGVEKLANEKGCTISQFCLAWCAQQPGVTSPIIGPENMAHLEDNLGALDVKITDADRAAVDALVPPGTHVVSYYDADFGPHPYRW